VDPIMLDRRFRAWCYGVSHSQLLLHAHADATYLEHVNVLFEDVRAVKLRSSYEPLSLAPAGDPVRNDMLAFADIPERHRRRFLTLTLSTEPRQDSSCARVRPS
jgi:hypothetical protein